MQRSIWKSNNNSNKNWATESKSNRWKEKSSSENWHIDVVKPQAIVYASSFDLEASAAVAAATTIFLFTKHIIFLLEPQQFLIVRVVVYYTKPFRRFWLLNLKLMCFGSKSEMEWKKRDGEDYALQQCRKEPMPKRTKKYKIKLNNFCSVNEHMIGITVARLVRARQNPIPMAKER